MFIVAQSQVFCLFLLTHRDIFFRLDALKCVFCVRAAMFRFVAWDSMGSLELLRDFIARYGL